MRVGNFATVSDIKAYIICLYLSKMVQFFGPLLSFRQTCRRRSISLLKSIQAKQKFRRAIFYILMHFNTRYYFYHFIFIRLSIFVLVFIQFGSIHFSYYSVRFCKIQVCERAIIFIFIFILASNTVFVCIMGY